MIYLDKTSNITIHDQIVSKISKLIVSGALQPDEKLPSVRKFASQLVVSTQTINKAYLELERQGYIYTQKNVGYFVKCINDVTKNEEIQKTFAKLENDIAYLTKLGIKIPEIINYIKKVEV